MINNWNQIYNPINEKYVNLNSNEGYNILKKYLKYVVIGGEDPSPVEYIKFF